jgi:DNA-binding response OmpR family regulator
MAIERTAEAGHILSVETLHVERQKEPRRSVRNTDQVVHPWSYLAKLGWGTIRLSPVEFRILTFLAARPYHAYSRRRIAEAVSTPSEPVTQETLGRYIRSLRRELGFYGNFIQRVPYLGYRFKA